MSDFESVIFGNLGQCGLFQTVVFVACNIADLPAAWAMTLMSFAGADPDWWSTKNVFNGTGNATHTIRSYKVCPKGPNEKVEFDKEIITIVSEWNLICAQDWIPNTITTIQMAGVMLGAFVIAQLGDLIGRKKAFFGGFFLMMIVTFLSSFSTSWQMFAVFRFFIGITLGGHLVVAYTLPIEYIGTKWRTIGGSCPAWAIGVSLLGLVSWIVQDWRKLSIITSAIGAPILLSWWFVPESCRWLLSKGKLDEAESVLEKMAKLNRKPKPDLSQLKEIMANELQQRREKKYTIVDLFKHWESLRPFLLCGFMFFSVVLGYYGFTLGVSKLSGNRHLNLFLSGLVEAASVISVIFLSMKLKRKYTSILLFLLGGFCSLGITVSYFTVEKSLFLTIQNVLALGAKFFLSAAFTCLYLITAEVFPTVVRNLGIGAVSTAGRAGGLLAPQIVYLHKVSVALPYVVCGTLLTISGFLCCFLKETYGLPLPDYLECDRKNNKSNETNVRLSDITLDSKA